MYIDYTNLFSPILLSLYHSFHIKKNDKIIVKYEKNILC